MTARELMELRAYYRLEPFGSQVVDYHGGQLAWMNSVGDYRLDQFRLWNLETRPPTAQDVYDKLTAYNAALPSPGSRQSSKASRNN